MIENFNQEKYGQRNMVETVFSVIKRKYNENVRSRKYFNQMDQNQNANPQYDSLKKEIYRANFLKF